jgi:Putative Ig domain
MDRFLQELSKLSPGTMAAIVALAGAFGAIVSAIVTVILGKFIVSPFLGARDRQDKEVEWRKHAIELTKLDLERKINAASITPPLRPAILDFLANYRDLQELGVKTPKDLYQDIKSKRISSNTLTLIPMTLPDGTANILYPPTTLRTSRETAPLKWSVTPPLPAGLTLDLTTGIISGTPTAASPKTTFTFSVTDSAVPPVSGTAKLDLVING